MKRIIPAIIISVLLISNNTHANSLGNFICTVEDVTASSPGSSPDHDFLKQNMEKQFFISVGEKMIIVDVKSKSLRNSSTEFEVVEYKNRFSDIYGISSSNIISLESVAVSKSEHAGRHAATVVLQSALFVNVWHLSCADVR
jgi:hypothetical protein